ncbi:MAG: amylo-alpha-1,6-glucosidase [Verrucomicrobiaceae bacterium]|nr:amylo-alpha-1,6-glucosidase [Verrucomicrobiaceae bacterium]
MRNRASQPMTQRIMRWDPATSSRQDLLSREWIVTNGLGGYASGTVSGAITRKYHGLLVAALPAPLGRMVMWSHISESLRFGENDVVSLGAEERSGGQLNLGVADYLREFRLEDGLPVWIYQVRDVTVEKRILLPHLQNTVHVSYRFSGSGKLPHLELRPAFLFRHHEMPVNEPTTAPYKLTVAEGRYEIAGVSDVLPPFRMRLHGCDSTFRVAPDWIHQVVYRTEQERGYASEGDLWRPGVFEIALGDNCTATMVGSTESWDIADLLTAEGVLRAERERRKRLLTQASAVAREGFPAELVFAADQFVIKPAGRLQDTARAQAAGDEVRTVIAGYHWFTDWGRDTMISLEGLALTTGRWVEAGYILRTFGHYVRDGLIPNMFPDGKNEGLYHTADATLWFFHALGRYLQHTRDEITLTLLLPTLVQIAEAHLRGTKFNIHVDPADGLLTQGAVGYQLTWMDAKMGDWVVTPRRGKAVELNALWYNALKLLADWLRQTGNDGDAQHYETCAEQTRASFNARFWFEEGGHLYDVVDCNAAPGANDNSCRPNQIFAISVDHPVLDETRWRSVVDVVERELVTPVGLRSLAPNHPDYRPIYSGDLRSRDGAYHQGTVWSWLIGPFVDAWLKVHDDDRAGARKFLEGFPQHLDEAGIGTISEVFHASAPHLAGGCIAQAWSVAEVLRCWVKTEPRSSVR